MNDPLLSPRGIAVVGASPKPSNIGRRVLDALRLHRFDGRLAAVNPGYSDIDGTPCHPTIRDIPFPVDLALIFVGAGRVLAAVGEAADAGAGAVVIYSSGFAETGADGAGQQERLREIARDRGIRVLGPNCQGLVDFRTGLAATFSPAVLNADRDALAPVAYVGQSGALGGVFFDLARQRGVTPTAWVSTGNEVDLTVAQAAMRVIEAGPLELLCLYLEQVPDGADWVALAGRAAELGTRIAVLRSGSSDSGRRAAASHTGALVSDDRPFQLTCEIYGVAQVEDINDLVDLAVEVAAARRTGRTARTARGTGLAVVTTSGGAGSLAADQAEAHGLSVPVLSARTRERLGEVLPAFGSATNPVDVTADLMMRKPEDLDLVCRIVAEDPGIDQVLLAVTNLVGEMAARVAGCLTPPDGVPLTMAYLAASDRTGDTPASLSDRGVAVHSGIRCAVRAMAALTVAPSAPSAPPAPPAPSPPAPRPSTLAEPGPELPEGTELTEWAATPLLDWAGVPHPEAVLITAPAQLPAAVAALGGRCVLKVQSPQVLHKSELGAVQVGVTETDAEAIGRRMLDSVHAAVPDALVQGVLVQRLCEPGVELLVGIRSGENGYPPTVTVGLGGITVELYGDIATAFAPLDTDAARALLARLRGFPLLDGFRGRPKHDVDAAARAIAGLSRTALIPGLLEIEINPLIVHAAGRGVTAVDLLVRKESS